MIFLFWATQNVGKGTKRFFKGVQKKDNGGCNMKAAQSSSAPRVGTLLPGQDEAAATTLQAQHKGPHSEATLHMMVPQTLMENKESGRKRAGSEWAAVTAA